VKSKVSSSQILAVVATLIILNITNVQASLLDSANPLLNKNSPLGRNPARAAVLKSKNKWNLSYGLGATLEYDKKFRKAYSEPDYSSYEGLDSYASDTYLNSYFSGAFKVFGESYFGLVHLNAGASRKLKYDPVVVDGTEYREDSFDINEKNSLNGIAFAMPIMKNMYLGLEAASITDLFSTVREQDKTGTYVLQRNTYQTVPYSEYTLGYLWEFRKDSQYLSLTYTPGATKFLQVEEKTESQAPTENEFTFYSAAKAGAAYVLKLDENFELGLSGEFFQSGQSYDLVSEDYVETKPFSRIAMALESDISNDWKIRIVGSYIKDKDARTNYFDWQLARDQQNLLPYNDGEKNVFDEEEIGLDIVRKFNDRFAMTMGVVKKNILFMDNGKLHSFFYDSRVYCSFSYSGIFEEKEIGQAEKEESALQEETEGPFLEESELEESVEPDENFVGPLPYDVTGDEELEAMAEINIPKIEDTSIIMKSNFEERIRVSETRVLPGTDIVVSIAENPHKKIFKASAVYSSGQRSYRYRFYKSGEITWETVLPFSPLTEAGDHRVKVYKIYEDATYDLVTFNITVKDIDPQFK
jgi:hypothetical protein